MELDQAKRLYKTYKTRPNLIDTYQAIAVMDTFYRELMDRDKKIKKLLGGGVNEDNRATK